jgi:hypothetical protein
MPGWIMSLFTDQQEATDEPINRAVALFMQGQA